MKAKDKLKAPPAAKVTRTNIGVYIGRRWTADDKVAHFWQFDGDDKPKGWLKQIVPAQIGEAFRFSYDDTSVYTRGEHRPQVVNEREAQFGQVAGWIAEDEATHQRELERKALRAMKNRETEFERALEPIRRIVNSVNSHNDRYALVDAIKRELLRPRSKK